MNNYELHLGDCLEVMKSIPDGSVDAVITDPPYDKRTHSGAIHYTAKEQISNNDIGIDDFESLANPAILVDEFLRISKRWCIVFCTLEDMKKYRDRAWEYEAWVRGGVWDKIAVTPQFSGDRPAQAVEGIAIFHRKERKYWNGGGKAGIWRHLVERGNKQHPTQKPVALMRELICQFTDKNETVIDPFMGSGTTGKACMMEGRRFIGIEIDPDYFAISEKRIYEASLQPRLIP